MQNGLAPAGFITQKRKREDQEEHYVSRAWKYLKMANTKCGTEFILAVNMNDSMDVHVHSSVACRQLTERVSDELPLAVRLERIRKADHKPHTL